MSKLIIGLTGGIGSGKTTVSRLFAQQKIDIIDADIIAREVVAPDSMALAAIKDNFGAGIIQGDGRLNRALLRNKIFSCDADKHWLNNLLHPLISEKIIKQTLLAKSPYCLLVAPLLIENNLVRSVNRVLVVDVIEATQVERTLTRDNHSTQAEILAIISSQISRTKRLKFANDIIDNSPSDLTQIKAQVLALHEQYLHLSTAY